PAAPAPRSRARPRRSPRAPRPGERAGRRGGAPCRPRAAPPARGPARGGRASETTGASRVRGTSRWHGDRTGRVPEGRSRYARSPRAASCPRSGRERQATAPSARSVEPVSLELLVQRAQPDSEALRGVLAIAVDGDERALDRVAFQL